jgi:DNA-binding beta-propeller fold protein YncE
VRAFSSADDVRREHSVLDRSLDIVAGPADPQGKTAVLSAPESVATDATHRIFVADAKAGLVHIFDFEQFRYSTLKAGDTGMRSPVGLAVDRRSHLYVTDTGLAAVLVFDTNGRFLRYLGKGEGSESYFQSPIGIVVHAPTGHVYVCDSRRHMILVLDQKGHILAHLGKRWGGKQPGEFRYPSRVAIIGDELFVLDSGNERVQVLDLAGHFRRQVKLIEASQDDGLAVDSEKNIYVSDAQLNIVNVFGTDGRLLYKVGGSGSKAGEFAEASGLWIDSENRLYIADTGNHRVQVFQIEKIPKS